MSMILHLFKRDDLPPRLLLYSRKDDILEQRLYYCVHKLKHFTF